MPKQEGLLKKEVPVTINQMSQINQNQEMNREALLTSVNQMEQIQQNSSVIANELQVAAPTIMEVSDKDKYRAKAVQGRNISQLLLNSEKFGGDSSEMKMVKDSIKELQRLTRKKKAKKKRKKKRKKKAKKKKKKKV